MQPVEQGGGGFTIRGYAKARGLHNSTVSKYVRGWQKLQSDAGASVTPLDALELAGMGETKASAAEIVAKANNVSVQTARKE